MEAMINQLFETLREQIQIYKNILEMSKSKTDIIVAGKIAELDNLVKMEQALILKVGRIERKREELAEKIAAGFGIDNANWKISTLIEYLTASQQEQLKEYQKDMQKVLEELKDSNEVNTKLIQHSLEYIEFSMNLITSSSVAGSGYENKGVAKQSKVVKNLFDVKL